MMDKHLNRQKGKIYEEKTRDYLIDHKVKIRSMNYRCPLGEIDVVAESGGSLLFVEVKYRRTDRFGKPFQAVDYYKRRHIIQTAMWYIKENTLDGYPIRFDVASWEQGQLTYYKGAFDYAE